MSKSGKYTFGLLAFASLIAGVIVLMEEITGKDEAHYVLPCGLIAIGLVIGFSALFASPDSSDSLTCDLIRDSDEGNEASALGDGKENDA